MDTLKKQLLRHADIIIMLVGLSFGGMGAWYTMKDQVVAAITIGNANAAAISTNTTHISAQDKKIDRMDFNIQRIAEKMKLPLFKRSDDE